MENYRLRRLRKLIAEDFNGSQTDLSHATGVSLSQIGQYLGGYRNIGERAARKIEEGARKPRGWLDLDSNVSPMRPGVSDNITPYTVQPRISEQNIPKEVNEITAMLLATDEEGRIRAKHAVSDVLYEYNRKRTESSGLNLPDQLLQKLASIKDPNLIIALEAMLTGFENPDAINQIAK